MSALSPFVTKIILCCAAILTALWVVLVIGRPVHRVWLAATSLGRTAFFLAMLILVGYGGSKNRTLMRLPSRTLTSADTVSQEEIDRGYRVVSVETNATVSYTRPDGTTHHAGISAHGGFHMWFPLALTPFVFPLGTNTLSSLTVFADGKVRPIPRDLVHTIGLTSDRVFAVAGESELWYGPTEDNRYLLTWHNFRDSSANDAPLSLQFEFLPTGDFIARSNDVEIVHQRIDPCDWDGDGMPNGLDLLPRHYDGHRFGPTDDMPANANTNAYYSIGVIATGANAEVVFTGDGPSNLPDPHFMACSGETNLVQLLIGKTYTIRSSQPIQCFVPEGDDISLSQVDACNYSVVWPVVVTSRARSMMSFQLYPDWLGGSFFWTNSCCEAESTDSLFSFACQDCGCEGCRADGLYRYEGYTLEIFGNECGCHPGNPPDLEYIGFTVPRCVFVNDDNDRETVEDDLRPINVTYHAGEDDANCKTVTVSCVKGAQRVRFYRNADRTQQLTLPLTTCLEDEEGLTIYAEGIVKSERRNDVSIKLRVEDGYGAFRETARFLTVARVKKVILSCGELNQPEQRKEFEGQTACPFNVTHSPHPDPHLVIRFSSVANPTDLSVRDFPVDAEVELEPRGFYLPGVNATFTPLDDTPSSGHFVWVNETWARFLNPKIAGVYRFAVSYDGSPTTEVNLVLPVSGGQMDAQILADLQRCEQVVSNILSYAYRYDISPTNFRLALHLFNNDTHGDYLGRPNNRQVPTVWYHNQVDNLSGQGASGTWFGHPTRIAKASNLIVGYAMRRIGANDLEMFLSQADGTWLGGNEDMFNIVGDLIASPSNYVSTVSNTVHTIWLKTRANETDRASRLWPSPVPVDNHVEVNRYTNPNYHFRSPKFLSFETDEDFKH